MIGVRTARLRDLTVKIGSGVTPRGGDAVYVDSGIALIRSQNIYNGEFLPGGLAYITEDQATVMEGASVLDRDVLLNITGDSVARCSLAPEGFLPARVNQHVAIVRPIESLLSPAFLMYFLTSPQMQSRMLSLAASGGTRKALTKAMIERFEIPIPSLTLQNAIASTLSSYDDLIENNRRRIQLLEQTARLLYREWFIHLRFPGHERVRIVDGVPAGWRRAPLGDALTLQRGFDLPSSQRSEGSVPVYGSTGINGYHGQAMVSGPGVITGRSGSLGQVMYVSGSFWPLNTSLWVKDFKLVSPQFAYFLLAGLGLEQFNGGAAVPTLNRNDVHRIEVLLPPKHLMDVFTNTASDLLQQTEKLRQLSAKLAETRDLLLPRLMSGEITV